jgi:RNA polymerase sigma factor (sigma-70 family)
MKIKYTFATNETAEIEVDDIITKELTELDRLEENRQWQARHHNCSMDEYTEVSGALIADKTTITDENALREIDAEIIQRAISTLTPLQKDLVHRVFFLGMNYTEIAKELGRSRQTITENFESAKKKLKTFFEKHPAFLGSNSPNSRR